MSALCTKEQVKEAGNISGTQDDTRIDTLISAVTQTIMRRYAREFVPQADNVARTFAVKSYLVDLAPFDLRATTLVELNPEEATPKTLTANSGYAFKPVGGSEKTATYLQIQIADDVDIVSSLYQKFGYAQLRITGNWGIWASAVSVAEDVSRAAIETVLSWLDRPTSTIAQYEELGEPRRVEPAIPQVWDIPSSAHRKLQVYNRNLGVY